MRNTILFVAFFLLSCVLAKQGRGQEVQIPVVEDGSVEVVDARLEEEVGLFLDYPNFVEARLFQVSDSTYVLEILYREGDRNLRDRVEMSAPEVLQFRQRLLDRLMAESPQAILDQDGRTKLIIGTTTLALGYYGWALPVAFNMEEGSAFTAMYMLTGGAGFFIPLAATRTMTVTDASATLGLYGASRGIGHGIVITYLFDEYPAESSVFLAGVAVSIVEGIAGFNIAKNSGMSAGRAVAIGVTGDFGSGMGLGASALGDYLEEGGAVWAASTLIGTGIGLGVGNRLARSQSYSRGDAYVLSTSGMLGALIPVTVVELFGAKTENPFILAAMIGSTGGLATGHWLTRDVDFSVSQGNLIRYSTLAGGLVGLGIGYLIAPDQDDATMILSAASLGSLVGFGLMYQAQTERFRRRSERRSALEFSLRPGGLYALARGRRSHRIDTAPPPVFSLRYAF